MVNDQRLPIQDLYSAYELLVNEFGWKKTVVHTQEVELEDGQSLALPILVFTTPQKGNALWILSGVHGEEPAGPNALARNIKSLGQLGENIPIVFFPLCNPLGYMKGWRYPNEYRDWKKGRSVSDSEYLLLSKEDERKPRVAASAGPEALAITQKVLELVPMFQPILSIDHHEDEALQESYIYSQGQQGVSDPVAQEIILLLKDSGISIQMSGSTRFGEEVHNGIIGPVNDGSVDELLAAPQIIVDGKLTKGPSAQTVIVIETPTIDVSLEKRVKAHEKIIQSYHLLLSLK